MAGGRRNVNIGANSIVYSGRGRPRTKETVDRPLPVGIILGAPSPGSAIFKNRKIRVGGPFQAKVPKTPSVLLESDPDGQGQTVISSSVVVYRSSRPPPSRVSTDHPHLTQHQVDDYERQEEVRQQDKEAFSIKQETLGPSTMEMDTSLSSQSNPSIEQGAAYTTTTISPDSSNCIFTNTTNAPKEATDSPQLQQQNSDTNSNDNSSDDHITGHAEDNAHDGHLLETQRGGLLLYTSNVARATNTDAVWSQQDEFWDFVQPLLAAKTMESSSLERVKGSALRKASWQEQVHQWYLDQQWRQEQAERRRTEELESQHQQDHLPRRRGRRKRKVEPAPCDAVPDKEESVLEWYDRHFGAQQRANKRSRVEGMMEEERAHAMEYLWLRHTGHVPMAKLEMMVQLSAGKAEMSRKIRQHKRRKAAPNKTVETLSWREYCKLSFLHSISGCFQQRSNPTGDAENHNKISTFAPMDSDNKMHQEIWKSILMLGQSIEESLDKAASCSKKDVQLEKLSTLTSFLNNVFLVRPLPEEVFRASDIPPTINKCFDNIASHVDQARKVQAQLLDLLYERNNDGVDMDALLKLLEQSRRSLTVELDDIKILHEQVDLGLDWQKRMDAMDESELCLSSLEDLAKEGRLLAFRARSLVCLENRIQKAYQLRDKIVEWRKACTLVNASDFIVNKECVRFLHSMVREANRLKLSFPEISDLRETHRSVEAWIDRANIAIRSKISLTEIKSLIERGEQLPVDLSDSMEKLRAREGLAEEWINQFEQVVPRPNPLPTETSIESEAMLLRWMRGMRDALHNGKYAVLHDIAIEGNRIPVEVDLVKLLQLELDAKNWTAKAKKWTPNSSEAESNGCKKGKLEDLKEHIGKAAVLRERLDLSPPIKESWTLDGETEIRAIVKAANDWFTQYKPYLDWDNRRSLGRICLSLATLRMIVDEANAIHANIGSATGKMTRILAQAEGWVKENEPLLLTCKVIPQNGSPVRPLEKRHVTLEGITAAAEAASADISLDLDEAKELLALVESVKNWSSRVANAAPKRSGRGRGRKVRFGVDDIIDLINEAANLPVDTTEDVNRLKIQLSGVQEWRANARERLDEIANGFLQLRHVVEDMYGAPDEYSRGRTEKGEVHEEEISDMKSETETCEEKKQREDGHGFETSSAAGSEPDCEGIQNFGNGTCNVHKLIKAYLREAKAFGVVSGEVEAADQLDKVSDWCVRSLKYLVTQRDVFDKRFFGAFDRFIKDGRELLSTSEAESMIKLDDFTFSVRLNQSWMDFVSDQVKRLGVLVAEREQFISWCDSAEEQLFSKEPPSLEKLREFSNRSRAFPAVCDMVQKVRGLFNKAVEWQVSTSKLLNGDEKLCPVKAKSILEVGEKYGFSCEEMKVLRNALRAAMNWSKRVKRSRAEDGSAHTNTIQALIDDHDDLLLEMPEELSMLKLAMQSYCLCRRPYSGFMIGCDTCEEWYHGNCIGITESKADRVDKYVCIRCSLTRALKNTAKEAVGIVRKWTCPKDLRRARQVEAQKHQRKVRKETKDIEKLRTQIQTLANIPMEQTQGTINCISANAPPTASTLPENTKTRADSDETEKPDGSEAFQKPGMPKLSPEEAQARIDKAHETIRQCGERLSCLNEKAEERKAILCEEDAKAPLLRNWCLRVRSLVLVPRSHEVAKDSRPRDDGTLSVSMESLINEAHEAGISSVADAEAMINTFRSMSWCLLATRILATKPTWTEMELLVTQAKRLKLGEDRALRMIKGIVLRAKSWQSKVWKALSPSPGETKPFNMESLKELAAGAEEIPVLMKEEALLLGVIEDAGARHCVCGGPTDARVMLGCDKCEKWFHGPCVSMSKEQCNAVEKWICPPCNGIASLVDAAECRIVWEDCDDLRQVKKRHTANEAPDLAKLWPPFGLYDSDLAREVLGGECSAIPDVSLTRVLPEPASAVSIQPAPSTDPQPTRVQPAPSTDPHPEIPKRSACDAVLAVPPTTLVQSADVSQELNSPLSQGVEPPSCAMLSGTDILCPQSQFATSVTKTSFEISQQQSFQWLAQSGASTLAATQVNLAQPQPRAFGWQFSPCLPVAASAESGASVSTPAAVEVENATNNVVSSSADEAQGYHVLSALETLAQLANDSQVLERTNAGTAVSVEVATGSLKLRPESVEGFSSAEVASETDNPVLNGCCAEQFLSPDVNEQSQLSSSPPSLNPTALNLIVAALPIQQSGS